MYVLGLSCFYHDSAACLLHNGTILSAAQEERFSRTRFDADFPVEAIRFCLSAANISMPQVDRIAYYEKPSLKVERQIAFGHRTAPKGKDQNDIQLLQKLLGPHFGKAGWPLEPEKLRSYRHHDSHAASAFHPSPFQEAAIMTLDGVGEWDTSCFYLARPDRLELLESNQLPHSIGLLYAAFTDYCGFKVNSGEYKLMGLAAYGRPLYEGLIYEKMIAIPKRGFPTLEQRYFDFSGKSRMTTDHFLDLLQKPRRRPGQRITQHYMDIAASIQKVTENVILGLARQLHDATASENLCLAGGVALNCVANGRLRREGPFKRIWVQPAAGDAGSAVGAACLAQLEAVPASQNRPIAPMTTAALGPSFSDDELQRAIDAFAFLPDVEVEEIRGEEQLAKDAAAHLADDTIVGWFQGAMEFGPRALGNRSILANPMSAEIHKNLNMKIKFRESFRPFAPVLPLRAVENYFDLSGESPFMSFVAKLRPELRHEPADPQARGLAKLKQSRSSIPAVVHVDYSARIQTVTPQSDPLLHTLLEEFGLLSGHPVLVNTSFNVRGEPIVCYPSEALACFAGTYMDMLYLGHYRVKKKNPDFLLDTRFKDSFEDD